MILISEMLVNFTAPALVLTCALPPPYPVQLGRYLNGVVRAGGKDNVRTQKLSELHTVYCIQRGRI